jgi:histidinol-phosphate aminotransferase
MNVEAIARQCILDRKEYVPGKPVEEVKREFGIDDIIKMASNENPLGTSPQAMAAMHDELEENANRYPESLCHDLVHKLAETHQLAPEQFFVDNGVDGVITMLGLTFLNPEDECIFGELTFPAYENIVTKMGSRCVKVPMTEDFRLDVDGFIAAITPHTKMIFVCNPNNPTGTIIQDEEFERLLEATPESVLVVADEAYYEFADDPSYPQSIDYMEDYPNLIILRTFSKIAGLAGLRVGYAMADPAVVKVMLKAREPFPVNRIAQAGAGAALDDVAFIERTLEVNRAGREQFYEAFEEMGLRYYPTQTNFIFVDLGRPVAPVFQAMLRDGVIIRPLSFVGEAGALRITIGLEEENERTIASLRNALSDE